jgi:hypothetical protein
VHNTISQTLSRLERLSDGWRFTKELSELNPSRLLRAPHEEVRHLIINELTIREVSRGGFITGGGPGSRLGAGGFVELPHAVPHR